tara:strand:+ start:517 stop:720 length:204 start_codon:yes stop_codon:yes gene_type:complete
MRELDLLLVGFLNNGYDNLSDAEQVSFESLLECSDDQLFRWFTAGGVPKDHNLSGIITRITENQRYS